MATKNQYHPQSVTHPGVTLAEKLAELVMGPKEFAIRTGKPEKTIIAIMKGTSSITPDMAVQFENVLNIPAHFWLSRQHQYDEYVAREKRKESIEEAVEWAKLFPCSEMIKNEWLPSHADWHQRTHALLTFFGISNHFAWEKYYLKQHLKIAFRISLKHTKEPYAISAWLRRGELQAAKLPEKPYSEKKLKKALT
ncbi:MAG: hypothetical protein ABI729_08030, partial [Chitinophagales bacterium]